MILSAFTSRTFPFFLSFFHGATYMNTDAQSHTKNIIDQKSVLLGTFPKSIQKKMLPLCFDDNCSVLLFECRATYLCYEREIDQAKATVKREYSETGNIEEAQHIADELLTEDMPLSAKRIELSDSLVIDAKPRRKVCPTQAKLNELKKKLEQENKATRESKVQVEIAKRLVKNNVDMEKAHRVEVQIETKAVIQEPVVRTIHNPPIPEPVVASVSKEQTADAVTKKEQEQKEKEEKALQVLTEKELRELNARKEQEAKQLIYNQMSKKAQLECAHIVNDAAISLAKFEFLYKVDMASGVVRSVRGAFNSAKKQSGNMAVAIEKTCSIAPRNIPEKLLQFKVKNSQGNFDTVQIVGEASNSAIIDDMYETANRLHEQRKAEQAQKQLSANTPKQFS